MEMRFQIVRVTFSLWSVGVMALILGCDMESPQMRDVVVRAAAPQADRVSMKRPLELSMTYEVKERYKQDGGGADLCSGSINFTFTNTQPIPVAVSFPPIAVFCGGEFSFAHSGNDRIPEFARAEQIVEFAPGETKVYTGSSLFVGSPGQYEWVFGKPSDGSTPEHLFVGSLFSKENARNR